MIILLKGIQSTFIFILKRNIQVPKFTRGKNVSRKIDENFHLIEPSGYSC